MSAHLTEIHLPVKLDDDYPCRGKSAKGRTIVWDDLLREGDEVSLNCYRGDPCDPAPPYGVVVRRPDGLWVVAEFDDCRSALNASQTGSDE